MKLQEGVELHFIESDKFTTNRIRVRFAAEMSEQTVAGRVLVANLLEMGNQDYPSAQRLRMRLAELYGAHFSTSVSKRGRVHFVDLTISYINPHYLPEQEDITGEIIDFLEACLFKPLKNGSAFKEDVFAVEKNNLISFLETEVEDNFYHADVEMSKLYYEDEAVQIPRVGRIDLVEQVTAETAFKTYSNMLRLDKIDIFVLGQVDQALVQEKFSSFSFKYRNPKLELEYQQAYSKVTRERVERKEARQSILELAYHLQVVYNDVNYPALLVFNGLLGAFSHSKLFMNVREKESLAYTIGSQISIFSGMLKIYAGINRQDKLKAIKLIRQQVMALKQGKFSEDDLNLTKNMLVHSATLAQDRQNNLLEQVYNQVTMGQRNVTLEEWIEAVNKVSREDILRVGQLVRLQAVYFMEGIKE
ncbi:insulinase family protein [Streptococcus suis]|uniref:EF-P 5-aminopentanol modification-associated protein YfmF n=1 Tax=Streptococcus TaxID=1301 RepID=UPI000CF527CA|nr:pitrilysin family protein [Streptococcus suis]NQH96362.1 insulinase family protein [Streptococcus suis]NQL66658.1 insulinase family protein [Streptococcus suis]NQO45972.1 insulinase family protein [Streptococcus suis]WNF83541.1 pitrilysin family protein [Streptococcus suis]